MTDTDSQTEQTPNLTTRRLIFFGIIIDLIILDQLSKWIITEMVLRPLTPAPNQSIDIVDWFMNAPEKLGFAKIELLPFFNLVMVWNHGVSFGMMQQSDQSGALLLVGLSAVICAWFGIWLLRSKSPLQMAGLSMAIAGAIGNIIDRLRFNAVIDFLDFHIAGYHWPAFNIADSLIVIGVVILIFHSWMSEKDFAR